MPSSAPTWKHRLLWGLASTVLPGLGQVLQRHFLMGAAMLFLTLFLWLMFIGWVVHLWSIIDAASYAPINRGSA